MKFKSYPHLILPSWLSCPRGLLSTPEFRTKLNQMGKGSKIIKSNLGIVFSVVNVISLLVCFAACIYYIHLYSSVSSFNSIAEERFMHILGFALTPLVELQNEDDRIYVLSSMTCYLLSCLPLLYVHLRTLLQPSFVA